MHPPSRATRLTGLDVARCLALVGMVTTHVVDARTASGDLSTGFWLAAGRSSALFALLAGVGLALATGARDPVAGRERAARSTGIVVRAAMIAVVGLWLGGLESGLAVILVCYGALFVLALPFLGLRAGPLLVAGAAWAVLGPLLVHALRPALPPRGFDSPSLAGLADPEALVSEVLVTGYYPVLAWLAYLLVGLGVGRLDLGSRRVAGLLAATGAGLAVASVAASHVLVRLPAVASRLLADQPDPGGVEGLLDAVSTGMYGGPAAGSSWAWLLVDAPHSTTPFDLVATIGSALLVLGVCVLLVGALPEVGRRATGIVFGAGAMTLSLYSLHVWLRTEPVWPADGPEGYRSHVLVLLVIGAGFAALGLRGPLEAVVRWGSRAAAGVVRRL